MDFSLTCTNIGDNLPLELSLQTPFTNEELHESLCTEFWQKLDSNTDNRCLRYHCLAISCIKLQGIMQYLASDTVKYDLSKFIVEANPDNSRQEINDYGKIHVALAKDKPGYYVGKHYDPARVWMSGMIYLNKTPDINRATEFYADEHDDSPFCLGNTEFNKGWAVPKKIWHAGKNNSDEDRYSILLFLHDTRKKEDNTGAHIKNV